MAIARAVRGLRYPRQTIVRFGF